MTVFFKTDVGFSAHKSGTLDSTDFSNEFNFLVGSWAGKSKNIGLGLSRRSSNTSFSEDKSYAATRWTDFYTSFRWRFFYPYIAFGFGQVEMKRPTQPLVDGIANQMGGGLNLKFPAGPYVVVQANSQFMSSLVTKDSTRANNELGTRTRYEVGVEIFPGKDWIHIPITYRYQKYRLKSFDEWHNEIETGPNIGVSMGYDF
jgi:hypothetical protein